MVHRFPVSHDPQHWGMVFPLGMYTVCTHELARAMNPQFLLEIQQFFVHAALLASRVIFVGLLKSFISAFSPAHNADHG
jgi:tellurite resistance protein TehA-like permease